MIRTQFSQALADRDMNAEDLKSHYDSVTQELLQSVPDELKQIIPRAEKAKECFEEHLKKNMSISLTKILELHARQTPYRLVTIPPKREGKN